MAVDIIVDAKLRRTGICGAAETLLIDARDADRLAAPLVEALKQRGCEIRGDEAIQKLVPDVNPASDADWSTEYLDTIISAGLVDGVDGAIRHINRWSSNHTDAIIAVDSEAVETVLQRNRQRDTEAQCINPVRRLVAEFGMGAEIGIATGKMHAARAGWSRAAHEFQICRARAVARSAAER